MRKKTIYFLCSLVFALGAADCVEAIWLVILLYALQSINQEFSEHIIIVGGLASLGAIMKSLRVVAISCGSAQLAKPIRQWVDFIAYAYEYNNIMVAVSALCLVISVVFIIVGCVSSN